MSKKCPQTREHTEGQIFVINIDNMIDKYTSHHVLHCLYFKNISPNLLNAYTEIIQDQDLPKHTYMLSIHIIIHTKIVVKAEIERLPRVPRKFQNPQSDKMPGFIFKVQNLVVNLEKHARKCKSLNRPVV